VPETTSVVDQYDIGDDTPQNSPAEGETAPAVSSPAVAPEASPATPASEVAKPVPPKDPVTGRFVSPASLPQQHPKLLAQTARDLGLDQGEIDATPTAELRELVRDAVSARSFNQHAQIVENAMERSRQVDPSVSSLPVSPEPPAATHPPTAGGSSPESELGIDESQYDAGLISLFKKQAKRIDELEKMVGHQHNYIKNQIDQTTTQKIDGAFEKLGGHYELLMGKGPRKAFADTTPEYIRRKAVVTLAAQLAGGTNANADQVVAKIDEAAKTLFGLRMTEPPAPKPAAPAPALSPEEIAWRAAGLARPTHREGSNEPPGPAKAEKAAAAYLADNGLSGGTEVIDDL